jgi:hypothetical protein
MTDLEKGLNSTQQAAGNPTRTDEINFYGWFDAAFSAASD